jgi:hypothetical protein
MYHVMYSYINVNYSISYSGLLLTFVNIILLKLVTGWKEFNLAFKDNNACSLHSIAKQFL